MDSSSDKLSRDRLYVLAGMTYKLPIGEIAHGTNLDVAMVREHIRWLKDGSFDLLFSDLSDLSLSQLVGQQKRVAQQVEKLTAEIDKCKLNSSTDPAENTAENTCTASMSY